MCLFLCVYTYICVLCKCVCVCLPCMQMCLPTVLADNNRIMNIMCVRTHVISICFCFVKTSCKSMYYLCSGYVDLCFGECVSCSSLVIRQTFITWSYFICIIHYLLLLLLLLNCFLQH